MMAAPDIGIEAVGADPARVERALALLREGLGQGFIAADHFMAYATPRVARPYRAALAATDRITGLMAGVLTVEIAGARAIRESFLGGYEQARADVDIAHLRTGRAGLIKSIAVAPASQGRGVATALITHGLRELAAHGAERYYSLAWIHAQRGCSLRGPLEAAGFRAARRIDRFWYQDSLAHGYLCPACGNPCECAVQVMVR